MRWKGTGNEMYQYAQRKVNVAPHQKRWWPMIKTHLQGPTWVFVNFVKKKSFSLIICLIASKLITKEHVHCKMVKIVEFIALIATKQSIKLTYMVCRIVSILSTIIMSSVIKTNRWQLSFLIVYPLLEYTERGFLVCSHIQFLTAATRVSLICTKWTISHPITEPLNWKTFCPVLRATPDNGWLL